MAGLAAGRLRHWVTIQQRVSVVDSHGDTVDSWQEVAQCWAAISYLNIRAREKVAASSINAEAVGEMVIRYRDNIRASMRVIHRGKFLNLLAPRTDANSGIEFLVIAFSEGLNDG